MTNKRILILITFSLLLILGFIIGSITFPKVHHGVVGIIDGDTIILENGKTVRLIGVDTPETVHPNKPVECYGLEAKEELENLLLKQTVIVKKGNKNKDKYGRLLRYVWVDGIFVNSYLIKNGFGKVYNYGVNKKYYKIFNSLEYSAIENEKGLWGVCE